MTPPRSEADHGVASHGPSPFPIAYVLVAGVVLASRSTRAGARRRLRLRQPGPEIRSGWRASEASSFRARTGRTNWCASSRKSSRVDPGSAEAHLLLGIAYRSVGSPDLMGEAVAELRQALALNPTSCPARYLSRPHLSRSRPERTRARRARGRARSQRHGNPQFLTLLGEVERQLKNPRRSLEVLTAGVRDRPVVGSGALLPGPGAPRSRAADEAIKELEARRAVRARNGRTCISASVRLSRCRPRRRGARRPSARRRTSIRRGPTSGFSWRARTG